MRLNYRILWIDDQPRHVRAFRERIDMHLASLGFVLDVQEVSGLSGVDAAIGGHIHDDGIDLVMVDYDLGPGSGGEEALASVRDRFRYKDILFYSASDPVHLRRIAFDRGLDGIHFSTRVSLADDAISIVDKTLNKVMDIDHMRGVVMAATSDIDLFIEKTVLRRHATASPQVQQEFKARVVAGIRDKMSEWAADLDRAESKPGIEAVMKLKHLYTASDRLRSLIGELEGLVTEGVTLLESAKEYRDNLIPRRNRLAHLVVRMVDGKRVLADVKGEGSEMDVDAMCELRKDLVRHRKNFEEIAVIVDVEFD